MSRPVAVMILCAAFSVSTGGANAATPEGTWLTGPDKKGNVAHVVARKCGVAICGTIVRAFNKSGQPIRSPNVGKRVFWDMTPAGARTYEGRAYVPSLGRSYGAQMKLNGNSMVVKGCAGPVCMDQIWTRVD